MAVPRLSGETQLHYVDSYEEVQQMFEWFRNDRGRTSLAVDTETGGLDFVNHKLRLVQVGDTRAGWAIPWELYGGHFKEILAKWDGVVSLHNAAFDLRFMEREDAWKTDWSRLSDTMIHAKIMRPGKSAALKPLATQFVDPGAARGQQKLKKKFKENDWFWDTIPLDVPEYNMYAALDTVETACLYDYFRADLAYPEVYDLEMAYLRCAYNMEKRGFRVDVEYAAKKEIELHDFVARSRDWAKAQYGLSIGSPAQLLQYFGKLDGELGARHEQHETNFGIEGETPECDALCGGVSVTETTDTGAPSMNAKQLKLFIKHPDKRVSTLAKVTYEARRADKTAGTYFKAIREKNVDGRIHPSINTLEAITSRSSVSNPSMQNLPSNSSVVKNAYLPEVGHVLLSHDADQVEFRIGTCLSQDPGLLALFRKMDSEGGDTFTEIMRDIYHDATLQKSDPRRGLVKGTVYGKLFGAGVEKMADTAGVPVEDMQATVNSFDKKYPGMNQYARDLTNLTKRRIKQEGEGYILNRTTGRRIPVESDKAFRCVNYTIQSTAADIMKMAIIKMDAAGLGENLRMPVHDEIIVDAPRETWEEVAETVNECMTVREGWDLPLTAEGSGPLDRWGAKYAEDGH